VIFVGNVSPEPASFTVTLNTGTADEEFVIKDEILSAAICVAGF